MKKVTTLISLSFLLAVASAQASEVTGTLSTGLGNSSVTGVVISMPQVSVAAGTYTTSQSVTLSSSGSLSIRYTTDGTAPTCTTGTVYTTAIGVTTTLTINAIACYANNASSGVASYVYTISAPGTTSGSSGGGGGGGGSSFFAPFVAATTTTSTTTLINSGSFVVATSTRGQVLGVSTVVFNINLRQGMRGKDVLELQKFLIAQGFLKIVTPTINFGPATKAALIAFQKKNNIVPASGFFGPLTRTVVNKMNSSI
jgi:hypothetical protein